MRLHVFAMMLLLSACATPPPQILGRYARGLSEGDIQQIKLLVSKEPRIDHRLRKLEVIRPDKVEVETGNIEKVGWGLVVIKRNGTWSIDRRSGFSAVSDRTIIVH
jgi:hypothetical protein